jgi:hypothetical protein
MFRSLTIILLCWSLAGHPAHTWASEYTPEAPPPSTALFDPLQASGASNTIRPIAPVFHTSMTSTFALAPYASSRLRDLSPETEGPRVKGLLAKMSWLEGRFVTETEIANSYGGTRWLENRMAGDQRMDTSTQMTRVGVRASAGTVTYGLTYRQAGQAFLNGSDQGQREIWGEWKANGIMLRSAVGQLWNNVAEDTTRPRLMQGYGRMSVGLARPVWPELSLTYARNSFSTMLEPLGIAPQHTQSHTLEGAVAYQSLRWNVRLSSSYAVTSDVLRGGSDSNVRTQLLTATFRPLNTFTISPMVGYREEIQDASGTRIDGPSASLALHYKQSRQLLISAMANYASVRSSDRLVDHENVGGKGILAWDVQRSSQWTTLIAIEAGYNRVSDRVSPSAGMEDISGLVRVVLADL